LKEAHKARRKGRVFFADQFAGIIEESEEGYQFTYDQKYLEDKNAQAVSITLPLKQEVYTSNTLFAFFDGLIPEGWLLKLAEKNWKLDQRDRMGLLLNCCKDCIGAVSIVEEN
jgi:serine/threonine-protein kinase HipA